MKKKSIKFIFAIILVCFIFNNYISEETRDNIKNFISEIYDTTPTSYEKCQLLSVIDGDTLLINYRGSIKKVRLIGIDTPESVHSDESKNSEYGTLASDYTKALLQNTETVYLEFDEEREDIYGRLLAYVYLDDSFYFMDSLNYLLVSDGYAINKEFAPNTKYAYELDSAYMYAKTNKVGLWETDCWE